MFEFFVGGAVLIGIAWFMGLFQSGEDPITTIRRLNMDEREEEAIPLILELSKTDSLAAAHLGVGLLEQGFGGRELVELCHEALRQWPRQALLRASLARALHQSGDSEAALATLDLAPVVSPELDLERSQILEDQGRSAEAKEAAERAQRSSRGALAGLNDGDGFYLKQAADFQVAAHSEDPLAHMEELQRSGQLAPNSHANHTHMGRAQRRQAPEPLTIRRPLLPVNESYKRALAASERYPDDALATCLLGIAELRGGDTTRAIAYFRRALEAEPGLFPVHLGLGAAMRTEQQRDLHHAQALPPATDLPAPLFPEWSALSDPERRVICSAFEPIAAHIPTLEANGTRLRIGSLQDREVDWGDEEGTLMCFVQDLLDLHPLVGMRAAHAAGFAIFEHLDDAKKLAVVELIELVEESPHLFEFSTGALDDPQHFFAVCYAAWVAERTVDHGGAPLSKEVATLVRRVLEPAPPTR